MVNIFNSFFLSSGKLIDCRAVFRKNYVFSMEKPGRHYLNQVIMFNLISTSLLIDTMYFLREPLRRAQHHFCGILAKKVYA